MPVMESKDGDWSDGGSVVFDGVVVEVVAQETSDDVEDNEDAKDVLLQATKTPTTTSWLPPPYTLEYLGGRAEHARVIPTYGNQGKVAKSGARSHVHVLLR